ncbi:MAG: hypothetical protein K2H85_06175 [Allobaculum sp.]|nr:hypothetical protein [Allobaculum sp.]
MEIIKSWLNSNGAELNTLYGLVLLFILLSFFMALVPNLKSKKSTDRSSYLSMICGFGSIFIIPPLLIYAFDGIGGTELRSSPIHFEEWVWFYKIILIVFAIVLLIFFLSICIDRDFKLFWDSMAIEGVIVLLTVIFLLLERGTKALFPHSGLVWFALFALHGFIVFWAYMILIFLPFTVFILGPIMSLLPGGRYRSNPTPEEVYIDSLDASERNWNDLSGIGYLTNDEAFINGKISANEWATSSLRRDHKLDKFRKK